VARLLLVLVILGSAAMQPVAGRAQETVPVTDAIRNGIVQAIQDEIYDYGYQGWGADVAEDHSAGRYTLRVYIEPKMKDFEGLLIYKLMPYGEVFRSYAVERNGLIRLDDDPELGFGPERPDRLTLYQDDDEISRYKHDWLRTEFTIELKPSEQRLREAAARQVKRIGHSVRLDPGWRRVPEGRDPRCPVR